LSTVKLSDIVRTWKTKQTKEVDEMENFNKLNSPIYMWGDHLQLKPTQDPYVTDCGRQYKAHMIDKEGNEYEMYWDVLPTFDYAETDESSACDWENPVELIAF